VDKAAITPELVSRLVTAQFPHWAGLPVRPVPRDGWDNTTFRLGDDMSVRLPSGDFYVPQVDKEQRWLPVLADALPLPIPRPLGQGSPGCGFGRPWSVYEWIAGETAGIAPIGDLTAFAADLAGFLNALYLVDTAGGPAAGTHSCYRGGPLTTYDGEARQAISDLADRIDTDLAARVWAAALATDWQSRPVWVHGDVSPENLLVTDGRLSAVIDFGCCAVGDPACDTVIAWTFLSGASRQEFMARLNVDRATWARGRGWALWKAMKVLVQALESDPADAIATRHVIEEILANHRAAP